MLLISKNSTKKTCFIVVAAVFFNLPVFAAGDEEDAAYYTKIMNALSRQFAQCKLYFFPEKQNNNSNKDGINKCNKDIIGKALSFLDGRDLAKSKVNSLGKFYKSLPHVSAECVTISDRFFASKESFKEIKKAFFDEKGKPKYKRLKRLVIEDGDFQGEYALMIPIGNAFFVSRLSIFLCLVLSRYKSLEELLVLTNAGIISEGAFPCFPCDAYPDKQCFPNIRTYPKIKKQGK